MKKIMIPTILAVTAAALLSGCGHAADSSLTPVTLNEVAHSIFYAPQYAAIELGYFEDEGIDLTLVNGAGADIPSMSERTRMSVIRKSITERETGPAVVC